MADEEWMDPSEDSRGGTDPFSQRIERYNDSIEDFKRKLRYGKVEKILYGILGGASMGAIASVLIQEYTGETVEIHNNQNYALLSIGGILGGFVGNRIWKGIKLSLEHRLKLLNDKRDQARNSRLGRKNEIKW